MIARGTGKTFAEKFNCRDYQSACSDVRYPLMRANCAETCGCGNWTSGLLVSRASAHGGCPVACKSRVQEQIDHASCVDLPLTSAASQGATSRIAWERYWNAMSQFVKLRMPKYDEHFVAIANAMLANGCNDTVVNPVSGHSFCWGDSGFLNHLGLQSIVAFCPYTCCRKSGARIAPGDCPRTCRL
eukprot:TRINITY_DN19065_c0_g1_i3.p1 TRINITY_DN19065_c0_g1~~TRINITY_DN19065_c0_g1_i3.p1  ORF type:complete len:198 (+),score=11.26 TRINITY_DN19065_c0_g1_i3:38-595(+)